MKKKTLLMISIVSFLLAGGCFYLATIYLDWLARETLFAPVVKVAEGKDLQPYEPITRNDLVVEMEEVDEILPGAFADIESVLGKRSMQTIFSGEQVVEKKLEDGYLLPEEGKARYEFPLTLMMPITELRKGDFVKVWVRFKGKAELEVLPPPKHFSIDNSSAELLFESQLVTVKDSNGMEIYTIQPQWLPEARNVPNPFFAASAQTGMADAEKRYHDYRAQPSAVPAFVGFNLTDQEYVKLAEAMQYGTVQIGHFVAKGGENG